MDTRETLRLAMLNAPALARLSGVKLHTVRALLSGKRGKRPHRSTLRKLAAALRKHSATLASVADTLDPD